MKQFEFRLSRVLDFRREQANVERARLQNFLAQVQKINDEIESLAIQVSDARDQIGQSVSVLGEDLSVFSDFERHTRDRIASLDQVRQQAQLQVTTQQSVVLEAERKVKLLLKLRQRKLSEWTFEEQKELETLAAESYLSRLAGTKRIRRQAETDEKALIKR
jgi:flagellar export protein FliJ